MEIFSDNTPGIAGVTHGGVKDLTPGPLRHIAGRVQSISAALRSCFDYSHCAAAALNSTMITKRGSHITSAAICARQYLASAARPHHALPAHADAVGVLVGAARAVVHQQLHVGHVSRLPRLAVQVAPLVGCGGSRVQTSQTHTGTKVNSHLSSLFQFIRLFLNWPQSNVFLPRAPGLLWQYGRR